MIIEQFLYIWLESSDVLSCSTYNENCQEDNLEGSPDEQAIFCSLFGENC